MNAFIGIVEIMVSKLVLKAWAIIITNALWLSIYKYQLEGIKVSPSDVQTFPTCFIFYSFNIILNGFMCGCMYVWLSSSYTSLSCSLSYIDYIVISLSVSLALSFSLLLYLFLFFSPFRYNILTAVVTASALSSSYCRLLIGFFSILLNVC